MIQSIVLWPSATLKERSTPVEPGDDVQQVIADMIDTMYAVDGLGISAIQIGVPLRIFVMDVEGEDIVFINPEITLQGHQETNNEGCLSLPGIVEEIERNYRVDVKALDRDGNPFEASYQGLLAQCVQHEIDHLDGVVMVDKISKERQEMVRLKIKHRRPKTKAE